MFERMLHLLREQKGMSTIEYGIIATLVALAVMGIVHYAGGRIVITG